MALSALVGLAAFAPGALAAPSGAIAGVVTDASTHKPIESLEVCAYALGSESSEEEPTGSYGCAKTGAGGEYTIAELNPGSYAVVFAASFISTVNYIEQAYKGILPPNEPTPVVVNVGATTGGIDAEMQEGSEISGKITNSATGAPVEGGFACALRSTGHGGVELIACARSAASGEYAIKGLPDGSFDVGFIALGLTTQYYPGKASIAEASVVTISAAKELKTGIDAAMQPRPPEPPTGEGPESGPSGLGGLPGGGGLTGPLGKPKLPVALASPMIGVEHRDVAIVKLVCAGAKSCRGKLVLSIGRSARRRGKMLTWRVPLGAERYSLRHGVTATVRITLDAHARALLRSRRGVLDARLTITQRASSSNRIELDKVILVEPKATTKR